MKKICLWLSMAVAMIASSCTENVLNGVPADADLVAVVNLREVLESAGGSVDGTSIKLPSFLTDELSSSDEEKVEELTDFYMKSGINPEYCALYAKFRDSHPVLVFMLKDRSKFLNSIEDNGYREKSSEEGMVVYSKKTHEGFDSEWDRYSYVAVSDDYVYRIDDVRVGSDFKPVQHFRRMSEKLADGNFGSTAYGEYINEGNVAGMYVKIPKEVKKDLRENGVPSDLLEFCEGSICLRGNLDVNKLVVDAKCFDTEGKEFDMSKLKKYYDTSATISSEALEYLGNDECAVYAASLKDIAWDRYEELLEESGELSRREVSEMKTVFEYLRNIDGTVAMGFGLPNGLESFGTIVSGNERVFLENISSTLVIETKDGKAEWLSNGLKDILEKVGFPLEEAGDGFTIELSKLGFGGTIELRHKDNFVIIANHPIRKGSCNSVVKNAGLGDALCAFFVGLNKDNKLMSDLNVKYDLELKVVVLPGKAEMQAELSVDGDDSRGLIAKIVKSAVGIANDAKEIEKKMGLNSRSYDYDDFYVDSVAVADEYYYGDTVAVAY
ncbi:MAG: hypothetical protein ACI30S_03105 [Muribaculaceae bacterium]